MKTGSSWKQENDSGNRSVVFQPQKTTAKVQNKHIKKITEIMPL